MGWIACLLCGMFLELALSLRVHGHLDALLQRELTSFMLARPRTIRHN